MIKQTVKLNYLRIAPRKVRTVAELIKGLSVNEAEAQLLFEKRRAAKPVLKLLRSAEASIKNNLRKDPNSFYVESIRVDQGPMIKRFMPRARGMASPIQKKTSHIFLVLAFNEKLAPPKFKIIVPKKKKSSSEEKKKKLSKKKTIERPEIEEKLIKVQEKPGFFRRVFSPKSRASK